jgi:uncharacterized membrane protein YkoI
MKRAFVLFAVAFLLSTFAVMAQKSLKVQDLPSAVQKTVQAQIKGAELKGLAKETEAGKTIYEVETIVNGKTRDFLVDAAGTLLEVEEETTLEAIPAAAKAAIQKAAAGGKISRVEIVTKGGKVTYDAAYTKGGKNAELSVTADGTIR